MTTINKPKPKLLEKDQLEEALKEHGFECMKKPIPLKFEVAPKAGICKTKEGDVSYGPNDYILTGTAGEEWPVSKNAFEETYDKLDDHTAAKKPIKVMALRLTEPANVQASWGLLHGEPEDYLVRYKEGDYGIVSHDIFINTYKIL